MTCVYINTGADTHGAVYRELVLTDMQVLEWVQRMYGWAELGAHGWAWPCEEAVYRRECRGRGWMGQSH